MTDGNQRDNAIRLLFLLLFLLFYLTNWPMMWCNIRYIVDITSYLMTRHNGSRSTPI